MEDKEISMMNVIPLIDIMLVLLTIVLVTSTFIASGKIPVDLPQAKASEKMENIPQEFIEIDSSGAFFYKNQEYSETELKSEVEKLPKETKIIIRADKKISLDIFVVILDMLKASGFENVSLQTGPKTSTH
ncbi:MAG: biopolymer transporter ExbD [Spirochaetia bacterium]|nr:biopolymer transporter ExbD [Spirochaetia bacterium]